jgi:hypothetical protein
MNELNFSIKLSIGFFTIGTVILILFGFSLSTTIGIIGYIFTGLSFFIGTVYLIILTARIVKNKVDRSMGIKSALVVIINIPVALFYIYLVVVLLNYARITFENTTGADLTSIKILGCQEHEIKTLKTGESKTVWIDIPNDCQVDIEYEVNGEIRREIVAGYLTNMNGLIETYRIGSNKDIPSDI